MDASLIPCIGCGARVPDTDGPTHRYLGASPGCWALYGEVLAREYTDYRFASVHNLTVDAYSAQHVGTPSPQTIQSAAVHLVSLYLQLEHGYDSMQAAQAKQKLVQGDYVWLDPPESLGALTIVDVQRETDPVGHVERVKEWAWSVWNAWAIHRATIEAWARF